MSSDCEMYLIYPKSDIYDGTSILYCGDREFYQIYPIIRYNRDLYILVNCTTRLTVRFAGPAVTGNIRENRWRRLGHVIDRIEVQDVHVQSQTEAGGTARRRAGERIHPTIGFLR